MRGLEQITKIISKAEDKIIDRAHESWWDMVLETGNARKNARARFKRTLAKIGITEEEWDLWENN